MKIDTADVQSPPAMLASGWMHICCKIRSGGGRLWSLRAQIAGTVALGAALSLIFTAGCASPGPPLPPSLKLPEVVKDVAATRVGDEVKLRWTTPTQTTDHLSVTGPITAEICREAPVASTPPQRFAATAQACSPVVHLEVKPGASEAGDVLPATLLAGPPQLLAYRVQLRNAVGRTAGASAAVFAVSGPAPLAVEGLHGTAVKGGAMLEWKPESSGSSTGDTVELDRIVVEAPTAVAAGREGKSGSPGGSKEAVELLLRVGGAAGDPGGAIDRTARTGESYRYMAQRIRTVEVGGRILEVKSEPSGSVTIAMLDIFPPNPPEGLVASPGFVADGSGAQRPTIDLSWEPGMEAGIAGYRVYRREVDGGAAAVRLNSALVAAPAYRDLSVTAGRRYGYRVTAVDGVGNESKASGEVVELAPAR
jgi:hypothetical protein